jgi:hypothetical protein
MNSKMLLAGIWLVVAIVSAAALGCESASSPSLDTNSEPAGDADGDGDADTGGGDGDGDSDGDGDTDTTSGTACDAYDMPFEVTPVKVMILQDFSASMSGAPWTNAKAALKAIFNVWKGKQIDFGFDIFADNDDCGFGKLQYDTSPDPAQVDQIVAWLDAHGANSPPSNTPLFGAMNNYTNTGWAPAFHDQTYPSYLMVVSDGDDTCTMPDDTQFGNLAANLRDNFAIKTFVVGFGGGAPVSTLNTIAANGGTSITTYIPAKDTTTLLAAFNDIAGSIVSCVYDVDTSNPAIDPEKVNFYFDDVVVPFNPDCATTPPGPDTGWRWTDSTHTAIEFCTLTCDKLKNGEVTEARAEFGCPSVVE